MRIPGARYLARRALGLGPVRHQNQATAALKAIAPELGIELVIARIGDRLALRFRRSPGSSC